MTGVESTPLPSALWPATVTLMLLGNGEHDNEESSMTFIQVLSTQDEAGTVTEPQLSPDIELP